MGMEERKERKWMVAKRIKNCVIVDFRKRCFLTSSSSLYSFFLFFSVSYLPFPPRWIAGADRARALDREVAVIVATVRAPPRAARVAVGERGRGMKRKREAGAGTPALGRGRGHVRGRGRGRALRDDTVLLAVPAVVMMMHTDTTAPLAVGAEDGVTKTTAEAAAAAAEAAAVVAEVVETGPARRAAQSTSPRGRSASRVGALAETWRTGESNPLLSACSSCVVFQAQRTRTPFDTRLRLSHRSATCDSCLIQVLVLLPAVSIAMMVCHDVPLPQNLSPDTALFRGVAFVEFDSNASAFIALDEVQKQVARQSKPFEIDDVPVSVTACSARERQQEDPYAATEPHPRPPLLAATFRWNRRKGMYEDKESG